MLRTFLLALAAASCTVRAAEPASFLRPGDRWVFSGDSITHNDMYREATEAVFRHFHPDVPVVFQQAGKPGVTSAEGPGAISEKPTVVSILLGINNYINSNCRPGMPITPFVEGYRKDIATQIKQYRDAGAVVLLLSPTLPDESFGHGIFEVQGGSAFLRECAKVLQELATADPTGGFYVPVQEEFEAFQQRVAPEEILRLDGVHPSALGQYQIARTLWQHLALAGAPGGTDRRLATPPNPVPATVSMKNRFLATADEKPCLLLQAEAPLHVKATWSCGEARGSAELDLAAAPVEWTPELPPAALPDKPGEIRRLILDLAAGENRSVYLLDLSRVPVSHPTDGRIDGRVESAKDRPEGKTVATWSARRLEQGLLFEGEVFDSELRGDEFWPWGRDGVDLYLDLRPIERFGGVGFDADVHITILSVTDTPSFSATLIPWVGRGMHLAADSGAERTATGYRWHLFINHYFAKPRPVRPTDLRLVGFSPVFVDRDAKGTEWYRGFDNGKAVDKYPNAFPVLDFDGKFAGDAVTSAHLFGGR